MTMCSAPTVNVVPLLPAAGRTALSSRHAHRTDPVHRTGVKFGSHLIQVKASLQQARCALRTGLSFARMECGLPRLAPSVVTRLRVRLVNGHATAAQLAVRSGAKRRPVIYVEWTPTHSNPSSSSRMST